MVLVAFRRSFYDPTMTEAIAFDTHRFVKRLTESGFTEKRAEPLAEEHIVLLNANLATKADIAEIKAGMEVFRQEAKTGLEALRQEFTAGIEALPQEAKARGSRPARKPCAWKPRRSSRRSRPIF